MLIALIKLDKKLREDNLHLSAKLKVDKPYLAIVTLKEVNEKYQVLVDGRLLSVYLMDRGDELPKGYSAPVRLKNLSNLLKVMDLLPEYNVWLPVLAPADDLSEDTVYAYAEEKDGHIEWSKFAYDEGRGYAVNAPPMSFDKGSYRLFVQQFIRIAEEVVNKY
ncbi:MAG: hypothetical protein LBD73_02760 [Deferribacteraceae bacterium]|nr:hypothetical protein [Deferribacteraceae bacterium]